MGTWHRGQVNRISIVILDTVAISRIVSEAVLDTDDDPVRRMTVSRSVCDGVMTNCERTISL